MVKARAITQAEVDAREAEAKREEKNAEALAYLRETDWYIVRQADTGEPVPDEVRKRRQEARDAIQHRQHTR